MGVNFTNSTLGAIGERALIARLRQIPQFVPTDVTTSIGDDCAVVHPFPNAPEDFVLKSDPILCGSHFLPSTPAQEVGHKALGRVLSDLASMGATPRWFLVDLVAPSDTPVDYIQSLYQSMSSLAASFQSAIIGGDTCRGNVLELHVFGCGSLPHGTARLRSTAQPTDSLWVTGRLGGSLLSGSHLTFAPRVQEGIWLRQHAHAMIDISDGLASELWHLAEESHVQIQLDTAAIPFSAAAAATADPLHHALFDGEDFELLFSLPAALQDTFAIQWQAVFPDLACTPIGWVSQNGTPAVQTTCGRPVPHGGFDHFTSPSA